MRKDSGKKSIHVPVDAVQADENDYFQSISNSCHLIVQQSQSGNSEYTVSIAKVP